MSHSKSHPQLHRAAMEELLLLTEVEQADLLASLKEDEARIEAEQYIEHDSCTFRDPFIAIRNIAMQ